MIPEKNKGDGTDRDGPPTCVGNPINFAMGNKVQEEEDYRNAGANHPLRFARIFNSADGYWRHSYATRLQIEAARITLIFSNGRESPFARNGSTITADPDELGRLTQSGTHWLYVDRDGTYHAFDANGRLVKQTRVDGHSHSLSYAANGAVTVTDNFGNSLSFTQDAQFQPLTLSAAGISVVYNYDTATRLLSAVRTIDAQVKVRTYHYENAAYPRFLTGITDELGIRFATFAYDSKGRGISTVHAGGVEQTQVTYNADGTTTVTNAFGKQTTYHFVVVNGVKRIVRIQGDPAPACPASNSTFTYSPRGQLTGQTNNEGNVTSHAFNNRGLETSRVEAVGTREERVTNIEWDATRPLPTLIEENGRRRTYTYDSAGKLLSKSITHTGVMPHKVQTWQWTYNTQNLVRTETAPNGAVTTHDYDTRGNLLAVTNALRQITSYEYDTANRIITSKAPNGLVTTYTWEGDRLLGQQVGNLPATKFTYHPTGTLATLTLPSGLVLSYTYDSAHRLTGWSNNRGESGAFTLDAMGNRTSEEVRDATGNIAWTVARTIDSLSRVTRKTEGTDQIEMFAYDLNNELVTETNGLNQSTRYRLDGLRRVTAITNATNATATLSWNALDNIIQAKDFKGVATNYAPDAQGNAASESSADAGLRSAQYDSLGLPIRIVDALGQATEIQRDALGRPTRLTFADGKTSTLRYDLSPSSIGYLSEIVDRSGTTAYTRDSFGRVTSKRQTLTSGLVQHVGYGYKASGLLESITYPNGGVLTYEYDATGVLRHIKWNGTYVVSNIQSRPDGRPAWWGWPFVNPSLGGRFRYDAANRVTWVDHGTDIVSGYTYDGAGRISSLRQTLLQPADADPTHSTVVTSNAKWNVGYDAAGRITSFNRIGHTAGFTYDANGNRTSSIRNLDGVTTSRSYGVEGASNKLTGFSQTTGSAATSVAYQYNANGDLVGDGLRRYTYDAEGRLSAVTTGATDASPTVRYAHNMLGQRVFKTEPLYPPAEGDENDPGFFQALIAFFAQFWAPNTTDAEKLGFAFVYDEGGNLIAETGTGGANSSGSTQYIYLPTPSGAMPMVAIINGAKYAVHSDHLNTPRKLTNDSGQPVWQWAFSAFGDEQPTTAANRFAAPGTGGVIGTPVTFNLRFPGQYYDKESGLNYNYFRSYSPATGRYNQSDPIGLDGGWNRFGYVGGNPLRNSDPLGLCPMCLIPALPYVGEAAVVAGAWWASQNTFQTKTPSTGDPGEWHTNPGNGQERLFGPDGRPAIDIDWHPDHGVGRPHGHNWDDGKRGPGVPLSPWPQVRTPNTCPTI